MATVRDSVEVPASADRVWAVLTDWERQGDWMLLTRVRATAQDGQGVGGGIEGWTGVGPVGVLDTMVIRTWEPPRRCVVAHTGKVVRGSGIFEVEPLGPARSRFTWVEELDLPLGAFGRAGWVLARPVFLLGVRWSLRRFVARVQG
ncbi:polyketide cyclase/dehydrase/lipid transport protein [Motilibacter rhizosphaerae]|uniref:Polyketide cyclase/dehydrase/lipid transport protein n=1 Tax=Motilibacter rhizosphaerae TaxID=598652 RepID=A0A4Q7NPP0_9ACTN|nr:SRPBCC family protein [Motilibacter rhizosphaerae]RZS87251.1 polyketide cyclase/dehydrase/lipid transport protein [Motilibacter rhizosphaerae]